MKSCFLSVRDHQKMAALRHFTLGNVAVALPIESNISYGCRLITLHLFTWEQIQTKDR